MPKRAAAAAIALALVAIAATAHGLRSEAHASYRASRRYEDIYYLPPPSTLSYFSVGWDEALADMIWMRALVYFGDEMYEGGRVQHAFDYAEAIYALDSRFQAVYSWVGTAALYKPVAVTIEEIRTALEFMERGAVIFPNDGELAWDIGATWVYELGPLLDDLDAKREARERGSPFLMRAARLGAGPQWAALSNATLLTEIGRSEQAARHLEEMVDLTSDPESRAQLLRRVAELRSRVEAEAFAAASAQLEEARRRDFPYVRPSLYLLLGPRPPIDVDRPMRHGFARYFARELDGAATGAGHDFAADGPDPDGHREAEDGNPRRAAPERSRAGGRSDGADSGGDGGGSGGLLDPVAGVEDAEGP